MLKKRTSLSILFVLAILAASSVCQSDVSVALSKILPAILPAAAEADVTAAPDPPAAPLQLAFRQPLLCRQRHPLQPARRQRRPSRRLPNWPASVSRSKPSVPAVQPAAAASSQQESSLIDTSSAQRGLIRLITPAPRANCALQRRRAIHLAICILAQTPSLFLCSWAQANIPSQFTII